MHYTYLWAALLKSSNLRVDKLSYGGREGRFSISHFAKRIRALRILQSGFAHRTLPKVDSLVALYTLQSGFEHRVLPKTNSLVAFCTSQSRFEHHTKRIRTLRKVDSLVAFRISQSRFAHLAFRKVDSLMVQGSFSKSKYNHKEQNYIM